MCPTLFNEIRDEVAQLLSQLIKIDTTNPPGNEVAAAKFLADYLKKEGFKCELFESSPGRGSIVTRLKGTGEGKTPNLLLLSHLDVVAANPNEWSVPPFSGKIKDGFVWGRGALDMKGMTAIEVTAMKLLKRNCVKPEGDVILAATADEEKGGEAGAGWLVENHPDKVEADYVINEGGGMAVPLNKVLMYTVQTAEKGILWLRIKAKGKPGHGSMPGAADNAILRMNRVISKLDAYNPQMVIVPTVKQFLTAMASERKEVEQILDAIVANPSSGDLILDQAAQGDKILAEQLRAQLRMTVTPTMINGGVKENIIPSECEAVFDCRMLPGQTPEEALSDIKSLLNDVGSDKLDFEIIQANAPSESPLDTPLYRLIAETTKEFEPHSIVAPILLTGGTDSRFFRKKGSMCYGFQPVKPDLPYGEMLKSIHGIDERISIENLVFGTSLLYSIIEKFMTQNE
jgi:acetylornithine deacetylase/succinyl-diaminopimelate desuccinylase-like protein